MRQRWWGATGRRVPELAVEGDEAVPVEEALVLDGVGDVEALRAAFDSGTIFSSGGTRNGMGWNEHFRSVDDFEAVQGEIRVAASASVDGEHHG